MKNLLLVITLLVLCCSVTIAQDGSPTPQNYVSISGQFSIEYPSDWEQISYANFDRYLDSRKAGRPIYDYDAVFASKAVSPFYLGTYFILTIDTVGNLSGKQIDSVLQDLSRNFGEGVKYFPVSDFMANMESDAPYYDKETKTVSIYSKFTQNETEIKNSLIMMKFYDQGIATFYFYAMGDNIDNEKKIFNQIVSSLSTEDLKSKLPKEEVKIADIDNSEKSSSDSDSSNVAIYVSLGVVLIIVISRRRKKKNNS